MKTDDAYKTMDDWLTPNGQKPPEPYIGMRMKTGKKFNKTHDKIYSLYKIKPNVVNDEMLLVAHVWREEGWSLSRDLLANLRYVTHPETISRRRRELHEAGIIEYSPKAMKTRTEAFKSERDKASPIPPQVHIEGDTAYMISSDKTLKAEIKSIGNMEFNNLPEQMRLV